MSRTKYLLLVHPNIEDTIQTKAFVMTARLSPRPGNPIKRMFRSDQPPEGFFNNVQRYIGTGAATVATVEDRIVFPRVEDAARRGVGPGSPWWDFSTGESSRGSIGSNGGCRDEERHDR